MMYIGKLSLPFDSLYSLRLELAGSPQIHWLSRRSFSCSGSCVGVHSSFHFRATHFLALYAIQTAIFVGPGVFFGYSLDLRGHADLPVRSPLSFFHFSPLPLIIPFLTASPGPFPSLLFLLPLPPPHSIRTEVSPFLICAACSLCYWFYSS